MLKFLFCCWLLLKIGSIAEEFIPVKPDIPARLQPNWDEEQTNEPGVSVITDCGCVGCCSLQPETIYETITLPSTNFCFFTAITTTTTDTTVTETSTLTSTTTRVSTLKLAEIITKVTTQSVIEVSLNTITLTRTIRTVVTQTQYTSRNSLSIVGSISYISRTPTRIVRDFIPFDIVSSISKTITLTTFQLTVSQSTSTFTQFSGTPTFGITTTTSTSTKDKGKPGEETTVTITTTSTYVQCFFPVGCNTPTIFPPGPFTNILTTVSLNLVSSTFMNYITYSTSVVYQETYYMVTGPFYTTVPFTEIFTYSYLP